MVQVPEWLVVAAIVTWLITVLGWIVNNHHANTREARKEYRSSLNNLETDVDRLLNSYLIYLTENAATENEQARISIYSDLNRLERHVEFLKADVGLELMDKFVDLYEAITGGDFESKSRKLANAGRDHIHAAAKTEVLIACAEAWFRKAYIRTGIRGFLLHA